MSSPAYRRCSSVSRPPHLRRMSFGISAPSSRIKSSSKLWEIWVTLPFFLTLIASRVARAGEWERKKGRVTQISHSLDDVLMRELGAEIPKDIRLKWGGLLTEEHLRYAGDDISHMKALHDALMGVLEKNGVKDRYDAVVARLPDFIGAAVRGIPLDAGRLEPILDGLESEIRDLGARLDELAPEHPEGGAWVWGNTSKGITPDGKGRQGALRALHLLGVDLGDL